MRSVSFVAAPQPDEVTSGHELGEGLPVLREPAYAAERSHDGEAKAASE